MLCLLDALKESDKVRLLRLVSGSNYWKHVCTIALLQLIDSRFSIWCTFIDHLTYLLNEMRLPAPASGPTLNSLFSCTLCWPLDWGKIFPPCPLYHPNILNLKHTAECTRQSLRKRPRRAKLVIGLYQLCWPSIRQNWAFRRSEEHIKPKRAILSSYSTSIMCIYEAETYCEGHSTAL